MDLKQIQTELKKVFSPEAHKIRDLPGGGQWVYLPWQVVRERLDAVYPAWVIDFSEVQYLNNEAICRCAITIEGIRKEAIASVPIQILSKSGKDISYGSAPDRLHGEAVKNAAEAWGVGRYLDNQEFTAKYLSDNLWKLDTKLQGELRKMLMQYKGVWKLQPQPQAQPQLPPTQTQPANTISQKQIKRLWTIAKNQGLTEEQIRAIIRGNGFEHTSEITTSKYEAIINQLQFPKQVDRNLINQEIISIMKRKQISVEQAQQICLQEFTVSSRSKLTDLQLIRLRDKLSILVPA